MTTGNKSCGGGLNEATLSVPYPIVQGLVWKWVCLQEGWHPSIQASNDTISPSRPLVLLGVHWAYAALTLPLSCLFHWRGNRRTPSCQFLLGSVWSQEGKREGGNLQLQGRWWERSRQGAVACPAPVQSVSLSCAPPAAPLLQPLPQRIFPQTAEEWTIHLNPLLVKYG